MQFMQFMFLMIQLFLALCCGVDG